MARLAVLWCSLKYEKLVPGISEGTLGANILANVSGKPVHSS
jgi:hypothetical protein